MRLAELAAAPRTFRVFVSSTFRDFVAERERIAKDVFPGVRALCEARGVAWRDVDLRWGISSEAAAEGRVLPICLDEIEHADCLVGILGNRYGWVPEEYPPEAVARWSWLREASGCSITELEMLHGALRPGHSPAHALFYLRDAGSDPDGGRDGGRLVALRRAIEGSGHPVRRFDTPEALTRLLRDDLTALVARRFPEREALTPAARDLARHVGLLRRHLDGFVPSPEELDALDRALAAPDARAVVTGAAGAGKTALSAAWLARAAATTPAPRTVSARVRGWLRPAPPGDAWQLVPFTVDAVARRAAWPGVLRHLARAAEEALGPEVAAPAEVRAAEELTDLEAVRPRLLRALGALARHRPVLVLVDGADRVSGGDPDAARAWLPDAWPNGVRLLATARPGAVVDTLVRSGWRDAPRVAPLSSGRRARLVAGHLAPYGKHLEAPLLDAIVAHPAAADPLFVRTVAEELRVFGSHEALSARAARALAQRDVVALTREVVARLEADHAARAPGVVRSALALIGLARAGLTEAELLRALGEGGRPLPAGLWAPIRASLSPHVVEAGDRLLLAHDAIAAAVADHDRVSAARARRAATLRARIVAALADGTAARRAEEIPWQLAAAGDWEGLARALVEPALLAAAWRDAPTDVLEAWTALAGAGHSALATYVHVLDDPAAHASLVAPVALVLTHLGHVDEAASVALRLGAADATDYGSDAAAARAEALAAAAVALRTAGRPADAVHSLDRAIALRRAAGDARGVRAALASRAVVLRDLGRLEEACESAAAAVDAATEGLERAECQVNLAATLALLGDGARAARVLAEARPAVERSGDAVALQAVLEIEGTLAAARGDRRTALAAFREQETICVGAAYRPGLLSSLLHQARVRQEELDFDGAIALLERRDGLCRARGDEAARAEGLVLRAVVCLNAGVPTLAAAPAREAARLAAACGLPRLRDVVRRLLADPRLSEAGRRGGGPHR